MIILSKCLRAGGLGMHPCRDILDLAKLADIDTRANASFRESLGDELIVGGNDGSARDAEFRGELSRRRKSIRRGKLPRYYATAQGGVYLLTQCTSIGVAERQAE